MYNLHSCAHPLATTMISCSKFPALAAKTSLSGTSSTSIRLRVYLPVAASTPLLTSLILSSGDSLGASAQESINRYDDVANQHPSSILALNHETIASTSEQVVPYAIQRLQQAGYRLVTLAECLGQQPYQWVGEPQTRDVCPIPCSLSFIITIIVCNSRTGLARGFTLPTRLHISVDFGLFVMNLRRFVTTHCYAWTWLRVGHLYFTP